MQQKNGQKEIRSDRMCVFFRNAKTMLEVNSHLLRIKESLQNLQVLRGYL